MPGAIKQVNHYLPWQTDKQNPGLAPGYFNLRRQADEEETFQNS
jgi:hypothetical protein